MTTSTYLAWIDQVHSNEEGEGHFLLDLMPLTSAHKLSQVGQNEFFNGDFWGIPSLPIVVPLGKDFPKDEKALIESLASKENSGATLVVTLRETRSEKFPPARLALQGTNDEANKVHEFFIDSIQAAAPQNTRSINSTLNFSKFISTTIQNSGAPHSDTSEFIRWLLQSALEHRDNVSVAVYNVGQGNANAIVDKYAHPLVFFDVGAPLSQFHWTRPPKFPKFFDCDRSHLRIDHTMDGFRAPVVLSHWDFDHWSGVVSNIHVTKDPISGNNVAKFDLDPQATDRYWIAPDQEHLNLGATHQELIRRLFSAKGHNGRSRLLYWPKSLSKIDFRTGAIYLNNGRKRNDCGLFLCLKGAGDTTILLPGDAKYNRMLAVAGKMKLAGLVVSHHGGAANKPPAPILPKYASNISCSVGCADPGNPNNKPHGHPNQKELSKLTKAGWKTPAHTYNSKTLAYTDMKTNNYVLSFDPHFTPRCTCGDVISANMTLVRP